MQVYHTSVQGVALYHTGIPVLVLVYPYLLLVQDSTQPDLVVVCYGESTDLVVDPTYHLRCTYPTEHRYGNSMLYPTPRSWYLYPYTVCCTGLPTVGAYVLPAYCGRHTYTCTCVSV